MRRFLRHVSPVCREKTECMKRFGFSDHGETLKQDEMRQLVKILEDDPRLLVDVVGRLSAQSRRRLIVAGGAMEWFGKDSALSEIKRADADKDLLISPKDFDHWLESALRRRHGESLTRGQEKCVGGSDMVVPFLTLVWIAFEAGLPFVGFGFLDNAVMILAGDAIDSTIGVYFNCSVLACAAMGNIFSGVLGMQFHGVIDKTVQKLNFNVPVLSESQMKARSVFLAGHIGGTVGIMTGLLLGMLPLLLLSGDEDKADRAMFQRWDRNGSGYLELELVGNALRDLGLPEAAVEVVLGKWGKEDKFDFEQFRKVRKDAQRVGNMLG